MLSAGSLSPNLISKNIPDNARGRGHTSFLFSSLLFLSSSLLLPRTLYISDLPIPSLFFNEQSLIDGTVIYVSMFKTLNGI